MSIQEVQRAAFEKWWDKQNIDPYTKGEHWETWNAALDSVVVELSESYNQGGYAATSRAAEAIEATGIRCEVKS